MTTSKKKKKPVVTAPAGSLVAIDDTITQEQKNWCWAACIDVVVRFRTNPSIKQCEVASPALGLSCCGFKSHPCYSTSHAASSPCDQGQTTSQITSLLTTFGIPATEDGPLTEPALTAELTANRLVGVHINWNSGGGGHMLIVYGCVGNKFHVYDPCQGSGPITFSELSHYMDGDGTWDLSWRNL
jgi:hypothetical protein